MKNQIKPIKPEVTSKAERIARLAAQVAQRVEIISPSAPTLADKAKRAWPSRSEFAAKLAHTRQANLLLRVPGILTAIPSVQRITPLCLTGDAGAGKGYNAAAIARALNFRFLSCLPGELDTVLAKEFNVAKNIPNTVLFVDESHAKPGAVNTLLLQLTNTAESPVYEGGTGDDSWVYDQRQHLLILATNQGETDPALVGENGRCVEVAMLPFSGADLAWFIGVNLKRVSEEYGVTFTPDVPAYVTSMTSGLARNVEDLISAIGQVYAGDTVTPEAIRQVALKLTDRNGKPVLCPLGMNGKTVGLMQLLAERGICREAVLKGALGQEARSFLGMKRFLLSSDYMEACDGGFRLTAKKGLPFVKEVAAFLATPIAPKTAKVTKGGRK